MKIKLKDVIISYDAITSTRSLSSGRSLIFACKGKPFYFRKNKTNIIKYRIHMYGFLFNYKCSKYFLSDKYDFGIF